MYSNLPFLSKLRHITPIIPVYFVIFEVTFTMYYYILLNTSSSFLSKSITLILFVPLSSMVIVTHIKSTLTSPGYVPIPYTPPKAISIENSIKNNETFCNKCNNYRPPRSHHCKICRKCTLRMDHHCPWIANCVGYYNMKFFYQFLFYATFGDLIGFVVMFCRLCCLDYNVKHNVPKGKKVNDVFELIWYMWEHIQVFVGCSCAFAMTVGIGKVFQKQTLMLLNNQTTIDKKKFPKWEDSPYYSRNKRRNFERIMGKGYLEWFMLKFQGEEEEEARFYMNLDEV